MSVVLALIAALVYGVQGKGSYYADLATGRTVKITDSLTSQTRSNRVATIDASADKANSTTSFRAFDIPAGEIAACN